MSWRNPQFANLTFQTISYRPSFHHTEDGAYHSYVTAVSQHDILLLVVQLPHAGVLRVEPWWGGVAGLAALVCLTREGDVAGGVGVGLVALVPHRAQDG